MIKLKNIHTNDVVPVELLEKTERTSKCGTTKWTVKMESGETTTVTGFQGWYEVK
jgi:hypothetical protein